MFCTSCRAWPQVLEGVAGLTSLTELWLGKNKIPKIQVHAGLAGCSCAGCGRSHRVLSSPLAVQGLESLTSLVRLDLQVRMRTACAHAACAGALPRCSLTRCGGWGGCVAEQPPGEHG